MAPNTPSPGDSISNTAPSWIAPGAGLTPDERRNNHAVSMRIFIISVTLLSVYNAIELAVLCFLTFKHYRGLYFYSLLISGLAIIPYSLGFLLDLLDVTTGDTRWLAVTLITVGWWPMVTGQALVLWSRLHLLLVGARGDQIIRRTLAMIIIDVIIFHLPTTVFTYGTNGNIDTEVFARGYNIMEKIQMTGFFCQEVVLSSIYIVETFKILRTSLQPDTRTTMKQLVAVNAVIILMDLGLLGMEAASLYILETMLKGVVYGIKLKLEFAILGKLVRFVGGGRPSIDQSMHYDPRKNSVGFVGTVTATNCRKKRDRGIEDDEVVLGDMDHISEFVDLERVGEDVTRPSRNMSSRSGNIGRRWLEFDYDEHDFARFQHVEDVTRLRDSLVVDIGDLDFTRHPDVRTRREMAID
ncbi:hypothetical protein VMCG_06718 [Cytospora schulzeri]|uniref:DUF7703 domain-containing protein n=1 Tax=Cytospora schulzeri TaxID=448051 RepID=A0A423W5T1_9PEZI|nr:hypothetical protein VMCG_06718 [Valsa malicola]